jgi:hypothetical protein
MSYYFCLVFIRPYIHQKGKNRYTVYINGFDFLLGAVATNVDVCILFSVNA